MTDAPAWTYQHATDLRDHWWWRPGWKVGTRFYAWHITFDHAPELHQLAAQYQAALAGLPGLDPVPRRWLHLTMQGVGHVEEIDINAIEGIVTSAQRRLADLGSISVQFHRPVIRPEAIALPALPPAAVDQIRSAIRAAIADHLGADEVPDNADGFQPHVTIAYSAGVQPARSVEAALAAVEPPAVTTAVPQASLIELHRDRRMYEWRTIAEAQIGT